MTDHETTNCHVTRPNGQAPLVSRKVKRYGWRPDLPDPRDLTAPMQMLSIRAAMSVDLRNQYMPSVYDQGTLGSCTANAIGAAYEYLQKKSGLRDYMPSRLFIYFGERQIEGTIGSDDGAMIRDGMKVIAKLGVPHETLWPYTISKFTQTPAAQAYNDALKHQCIKYRRVSVGETAVRNALTLGCPVVFGFSVPESFEGDEIATTGMFRPQANEPIIGGHAVLAVGYKTISGTLYAIVRNSWGSAWGDNGYFYMPLSWMCNPNNADDFWIIQQVEA
jgi:C1A family cysteine protease